MLAEGVNECITNSFYSPNKKKQKTVIEVMWFVGLPLV